MVNQVALAQVVFCASPKQLLPPQDKDDSLKHSNKKTLLNGDVVLQRTGSAKKKLHTS